MPTVISKQELIAGIRLAGRRAVANVLTTRDWEHEISPGWTTRDAFCHVAADAKAARHFYESFRSGRYEGMSNAQLAERLRQMIAKYASLSPEELARVITDGCEQSVAFVESLTDEQLAEPIRLGGQQGSMAELLAVSLIDHAIAHCYEAAKRWPLE